MERDDGGLAFPRLAKLRDRQPEGRSFDAESTGGMTLRDYLAGQALVALINHENAGDCTPAQIALDAYLYADAMLAARASHVSPRTGDAAE